MREIDNVRYYDIFEIAKMFTSGETEETIRNQFENGKIKGKKIEENWYATKEQIEDFVTEKEGTGIFFTHPLKINLSTINLKGRILDIGGGGEGIIGQLKGENVVSIDRRKNELKEALEAGDTESLKIVMDAKELKFLDNSFDTVTAFFSIMYMPNKDHVNIFDEIRRVLREKGEFIIWDPIIPKRKDKKKELYVVLIRIQIYDREVITGYGTRWIAKEQDINYFIDLAKNTGFSIIDQKVEGDYFFLKLQKY
ncbi:MAG: class I SAM-dependent methyltransferase [Promethearchaeota archaeon]